MTTISTLHDAELVAEELVKQGCFQRQERVQGEGKNWRVVRPDASRIGVLYIVRTYESAQSEPARLPNEPQALRHLLDKINPSIASAGYGPFIALARFSPVSDSPRTIREISVWRIPVDLLSPFAKHISIDDLGIPMFHIDEATASRDNLGRANLP